MLSWDTVKVVVLLLTITAQMKTCRSANCETMDGPWYNTLGSEMILNHTSDGFILGEYRTAVEREPGAAGSSHSIVIGAAPVQPGSVFGMSVSWRSGASTTAWTGQCHMCDGQEILMTSWMLRSQVDTCKDLWMSVRVGHDYFSRNETAFGPRKHLGTDTPTDYDTSRKKRHVMMEDILTEELKQRSRVKRETLPDTDVPSCGFPGLWYNDGGSQLTFIHYNDGVLGGKYKTPKEIKANKASGKHSDVYGIGITDIQNKTMAFFVVWNGGKSITAWVGQCHLCGIDQVQQLGAVWLHRKSVESCSHNGKSTLLGENKFTRYYVDPVGKHDDRSEYGEVDDEEEDQKKPCPSAAPSLLRVTTFWMTCVLVFGSRVL